MSEVAGRRVTDGMDPVAGPPLHELALVGRNYEGGGGEAGWQPPGGAGEGVAKQAGHAAPSVHQQDAVCEKSVEEGGEQRQQAAAHSRAGLDPDEVPGQRVRATHRHVGTYCERQYISAFSVTRTTVMRFEPTHRHVERQEKRMMYALR